jgi:hypothetical protein
MATAGVPVVVAAANGAGLALATSTAITDGVGVTVDTATYSTTPAAGAEGVVSVIINPDAVFRIRLNDGATAGTQLDYITESAGGSKTANTITTGNDAPNSPEMDEGTIVCVTGANAGQSRKITSTSATVATVTVGWYNNNASGDTFILVPFHPLDVAADNVNLTSNLAEARQDIAVGTGADLRVMDLVFDLASLEAARNNSYVFAVLDDHVLQTAT